MRTGVSLHGPAVRWLSNKPGLVRAMPWRATRRRNLIATPVFPRPGRTGQHGHYPLKCRFASVDHIAGAGAVRSRILQTEHAACYYPTAQTDYHARTRLQNNPRRPRLCWHLARMLPQKMASCAHVARENDIFRACCSLAMVHVLP